MEIFVIILRSAFVYLALRVHFIILVSELNGALYCDSANTSFFVEYISRLGMVIVLVNVHFSAVDENSKGAY